MTRGRGGSGAEVSVNLSAAEGRSPNARIDCALCWRGAASTIEQLKWFREFSRQTAEYSFVWK